MTTRQINEALGINGGYINGEPYNIQGNPKISRARKKNGVLQFFLVSREMPGAWFRTWKNAGNNWQIQDGNGKLIAKSEW